MVILEGLTTVRPYTWEVIILKMAVAHRLDEAGSSTGIFRGHRHRIIFYKTFDHVIWRAVREGASSGSQ